MKKTSLLLFLLSLAVTASSQSGPGKYVSLSSAARLYKKVLDHQTYLVFPEAKEYPIKWRDSVGINWLQEGHSKKPYLLRTHAGEYFVFQTGIWAFHDKLENVRIRFSDFKSRRGGVISSDSLTCFNAGGISYLGRPFKKEINVGPHQVQALWMGIDIPADAQGSYLGTIEILAGGMPKKVNLQLDVEGKALPDHGFDKGDNLSRLEWLNSTVGVDDEVTKGYIPVSRNGDTIKLLGRSVKIAEDGLPERITTYFTRSNQSISTHGEPITDIPFQFTIEKENGTIVHLKPGALQFTGQTPSFVRWKVTNTSEECDMTCEGKLEFDGFIDYQLTVKANEPLNIKDIRLKIALDKNKAIYMMGLNKPGGFRPPSWHWRWDTTKNQDALWLGAVNGGLQIKWKGDNYRSPLVNVYYSFGRLRLPPSWGNNGKGGVDMVEQKNDVAVNAYSGSRFMKKGEEQHYDFQLLITPFKTINKKALFADRYYQSGNNKTGRFIPTADSLGANIITVHQGNDLYPFINYPYSDVNITALRHFIEEVHQDHKRAKVYYTTRELTVNLPELWSFLSLDGEIVYPGPGADAKTVTDPNGPDPWLLKNLKGRKYIPAWVSHFTKGKYAGMQDLSLITVPDSRLNNFYVAGLDWMVHHLEIDGIYIDDCSMDRTTLRRVRTILDNNRRYADIDMHSWNHFNPYAGWASCLNLYMSLLPYLDHLWIGEGRNYNTPPDYWLVEISGIPFGVPSQMLQGGGNPWRGMVYGMTNRAGWSGTPPDNIWKFWDQYHIEQKEMIGYWDPGNPATVNNDSVKITVYRGKRCSILAVGNFASTPQSCTIHLDYGKLGFPQSKSVMFTPAIYRFQDSQQLKSLGHLNIPAKKGYLIIVKSNDL
jgi:hypothetical protein